MPWTTTTISATLVMCAPSAAKESKNMQTPTGRFEQCQTVLRVSGLQPKRYKGLIVIFLFCFILSAGQKALGFFNNALKMMSTYQDERKHQCILEIFLPSPNNVNIKIT
uniref:Uncharacterized protein n=1 Tax=Ixodes ricinus TaxID=34613 RepID=A0A6B0UIR3_IXORI